MSEKIKLSCRLAKELVDFLDAQVESKVRKGMKADRSQEIAIAIRQRQISKLPDEQRAALYAKLNIAS